VPSDYTPTSYEVVNMENSQVLASANYINGNQIGYTVMNWAPGVFEIGINCYTKEGLTGHSIIEVTILSRDSNTTTDDESSTPPTDTNDTTESENPPEGTTDDPINSLMDMIPGFSSTILFFTSLLTITLIGLYWIANQRNKP
jgi:hypothetical protein